MAQSAKGAGNLLVPLVVVAVVVVGVLALTFSMSEEDPPAEATIIPEEEFEGREAGAGTLPDGEADETMEGVTDQLDEVDPAAPGEETIPPAELATDSPDEQTAGETAADEQAAGTADQPVVEDAPTEEGAAEGGAGDPASGEAARLVPMDENAASEDEAEGAAAQYLIEEDSGAAGSENVDTPAEPSEDGVPAGRDADTNLTPEPGQDVVEDTDDGGAPFIPTPSGPEGREPDPR